MRPRLRDIERAFAMRQLRNIRQRVARRISDARRCIMRSRRLMRMRKNVWFWLTVVSPPRRSSRARSCSSITCGPRPVFCDGGGAARKVRQTVFAYPLGIPMPAFGSSACSASRSPRSCPAVRARIAQLVLAAFGGVVARRPLRRPGASSASSARTARSSTRRRSCSPRSRSRAATQGLGSARRSRVVRLASVVGLARRDRRPARDRLHACARSPIDVPPPIAEEMRSDRAARSRSSTSSTSSARSAG